MISYYSDGWPVDSAEQFAHGACHIGHPHRFGERAVTHRKRIAAKARRPQRGDEYRTARPGQCTADRAAASLLAVRHRPHGLHGHVAGKPAAMVSGAAIPIVYQGQQFPTEGR
jgi:hypothetical protein